MASHTISFVPQAKQSIGHRKRARRTDGSLRLCAWRMLPFAALALLLCGRPPAGWAQPAPVPGGYVQLYPASSAIPQGQTVQLRAAVMNPLGFELPNRQVTWKSSNAAIAGVSAAGLVTASAPGTVTITAKSGAALGTATVIVSGAPLNTPPVVAITAPADGATFPLATPITLTGAATDLQSGNLSNLIVWTAASAADPNGTQQQLGTGASVVSSSLAAGSYLVTASATDSGGLTGIAQLGITIRPPCSQVVKLLPASGVYIPQLLQLDATQSSDSCGRPLQYFWYFYSDTSLERDTFLAQANSAGNTNATPVLNLQVWDVVAIAVKVCVAGTNECTPTPNPAYFTGNGSNVYEGASVF